MEFFKKIILLISIVSIGLLFMVYYEFLRNDKYMIDEELLIFLRIVNILTIVFFGILIVYVWNPFKKKSKNIFENKISFNDKKTTKDVPIEFEDMYKQIYINSIAKYEKLQRRARIGVISGTVLFINLVVLRGVWEFDEIELFIYILPIFATMAIFSGIIFFFYATYIGRYYKNFKNEIITNIVKIANNKLRYIVEDESLETSYISVYKNAEFDKENFNICYSEDIIEGFLDKNVYMHMIDLDLRYEVGSGEDKSEHQVFEGIFVYTNIDNYINEHIKISINKKIDFNKDKKVDMDSTQFEKYFDVYSKDKILTMKCLTHDVMEILVLFYEKYNIDFEVVLKEKNIYLRFFIKNMFEPNLFGKVIDKELLYTYFFILKFISDLTKEVNKALEGTII